MQLYEKIKHFSLTTPDVVAFTSGEKSITYSNLEKKSNALSAYFYEKIGNDRSPIVVYGHMEPDMLTSFLGSVKSGHPYIPIDTSVPEERVIKIVENSGAKIFLSLVELPESFDKITIDKLTYDQMEEVIKEYSNLSAPSEANVKGDNDFYIIYTSGSTGMPKGVQITANCLNSFTNWILSDFKLKNEKVFLNQAPFSFDLSVMDLYPCLLSGGTLYAITKDLIANPKLLFQSLENSEIEVWTSTPSFAEMCLQDPSFSCELLPNVTTFLFCGEALSVDVAKKLLERFPKANIWNTYGPTEATVAVTSILITENVLSTYDILPIGFSKADGEIIIVDENNQPLKDGEKGEIVIVGPSVAKGYLGNKELTTKSFISINGKNAYKTGDAGYLENGLLFYNGRLDFQVKLNGYRMEIEEIEHYLRLTSYVNSAVVLPVYKENKCQYLIAAIVANEHSFVKEFQLTSAIKKELATLIPSYMVPRKFVYIENLPMTNNGKIDRKKLLSEVLS